MVNEPDLPDPGNALNDLEPEMRDGPLGLPVLVPKGAPDLPEGGNPLDG